MKKVYIETLGCQMNKSDAERMYGMLEYCGYTQTDKPKEADMLIINDITNLRQDETQENIPAAPEGRIRDQDQERP